MNTYVHKLLRKKNITFLAIFFMVTSAITTFFVIDANHHRIAELTQEAKAAESLIRDQWMNLGLHNHNADMAVIVSLLLKDAPPTQLTLRQHYLARLQIPANNAALSNPLTNAEVSITKTLQDMEQEQMRTIDNINETWVRQNETERAIERLKEKNMFYMTLAFFMQVVGVVLVILSREMVDSF